jgi:transposase
VSQKTRSTFVLVHPSEILQALVGLKDVSILQYERLGPHVELMVEQVLGDVRCPSCNQAAQPIHVWPLCPWRAVECGAY